MTLAVFLAVVLSRPVGAAPALRDHRPEHRVHLVQPLLRRLPAHTQANARATGILEVLKSGNRPFMGSAFLVLSPRADGRALIMTNNHVIDDMLLARTRLEDAAGTYHQSNARVVLRDPKLDYALLEVSLPAGPWQAVSIAARTPRDEDVYTVGYPAPQRIPPRFVEGATRRVFGELVQRWNIASTPAERLTALVDIPRTMTMGRVVPDSVRGWTSRLLGPPQLQIQLPTGEGASGSPLFSRPDGNVVGLVFGGYPDKGTPRGLARPMEAIIGHVRKLAPSLTGPDQELVRAFLADTAATH